MREGLVGKRGEGDLGESDLHVRRRSEPSICSVLPSISR